MQTTTHFPPLPILMQYDSNLLSAPIFSFDADYFRKIAEWIEKKVHSAEYRKFPNTIQKLKQQQQQFMELYERAKTKEGENKNKTNIKANAPFYRPRLANINDQRSFEKLNDRRRISKPCG